MPRLPPPLPPDPRYLELFEFSVALFQAPAESITQTIIYARNNQMANGMYINHGLFVASIVLSLGDMLLVIFKLLRYKGGPGARIWIALTRLDKVRAIIIILSIIIILFKK